MCLLFMQEVDYSNNEIEEIGDLSPHQSLQTLILDGMLMTCTLSDVSISNLKSKVVGTCKLSSQ